MFKSGQPYLRVPRLWLVAAALALLFVVYGVRRNSAKELYVSVPVERGAIAKYVKATGAVEPAVTVDVSSQLSGRVAEVLVNFNDAVKQHQVIARLDPEAYDASVGQAKAALKVAEANALLQKKTIEAALASAETGLRRAGQAGRARLPAFCQAGAKRQARWKMSSCCWAIATCRRDRRGSARSPRATISGSATAPITGPINSPAASSSASPCARHRQ